MLYSDSICLWIVCVCVRVCVCVNTNYDYDAAFASLGNHLPAPSPGYSPGGRRSSLAVAGLLFLSSAAISSVSRVHHQAYFCGFPFFGGAGNIFFGLEFIYHAVHPFQEIQLSVFGYSHRGVSLSRQSVLHCFYYPRKKPHFPSSNPSSTIAKH